MSTVSKPHKVVPHPLIDTVPTTKHNDVVRLQEKHQRKWELVTYWSLAFAIVLAVVCCVQWLTRKEQYYALLPLDGQGLSWHMTRLDAESAHTLAARMLLVQAFIKGIRTVSIDQKLQDLSMNPAFFMCRDKAQGYLREYFSRPENDPKTLQKKGISKVPVDIVVAPQTEGSFRVSWVEEVQEITATVRTRWDATVTLETKDPAELKSQEREFSPLGIFVNYVNFNNLGKI